jgi:hypothetical protein
VQTVKMQFVCVGQNTSEREIRAMSGTLKRTTQINTRSTKTVPALHTSVNKFMSAIFRLGEKVHLTRRKPDIDWTWCPRLWLNLSSDRASKRHHRCRRSTLKSDQKSPLVRPQEPFQLQRWLRWSRFSRRQNAAFRPEMSAGTESEQRKSTHEPDSGDLPIRFGGRGDRIQSVLPALFRCGGEAELFLRSGGCDGVCWSDAAKLFTADNDEQGI